MNIERFWGSVVEHCRTPEDVGELGEQNVASRQGPDITLEGAHVYYKIICYAAKIS